MNWYVLFALSYRVEKLLIFLNRYESIEAFSPQMEFYFRKTKTIEIKPLFKGYIFIKTKLNQIEFNNILNSMDDKDGLIKQLCYEDTTALTKEEICLFENILDDSYILRMSQAFVEDGRTRIINGPLKDYDRHIIKVDKRNKMAYLDLEFMNRHIKAGVEYMKKF